MFSFVYMSPHYGNFVSHYPGFRKPVQHSKPSDKTNSHFARKKLAIVGGGFSGCAIASLLDKELDVVVISKNPYFENLCSLYKVVVAPSIIHDNRIPISKLAPHSKVIIGEVDEISANSLRVGNRNVDFDYLVVASGASYQHSYAPNDRVISLTDGKHCVEANKALQHSNIIAVIGGGPTGVETALEIGETYPKKKVFFFHSGDTYLERFNPKAQQIASSAVGRTPNVESLFNQRVKSIERVDGGVLIHSNTGSTFANLVYLCGGMKPNTSFLKKNMESILTSSGHVKVNPSLQVQGFPHIFAVGDVTALPEEKLAFNALRQAKVAANNIRDLSKGKNPGSQYKVGYNSPTCIALGNFNGMIVRNQDVDSGPHCLGPKHGVLSARIMMTFTSPFFKLMSRWMPNV